MRYRTTVVADIDDGARLVDEEQFGPAIPVVRYTDVDTAVRRANDSEQGLGASVWSSDVDAAVSHWVLRSLQPTNAIKLAFRIVRGIDEKAHHDAATF